eukprot:g2949.t1
MMIFSCIALLASLAASEAAPAVFASYPTTAEQWGVWELMLRGPSDGDVVNPFVDVSFNASFTLGDTNTSSNATTIAVAGFYDGSGTYVLRFSPPLRGTWRFMTFSNTRSLCGHNGSIVVVGAHPNQHGPVLSRGHELVHADGTSHVSTGTTCYQWASMPLATQRATLTSLTATAGRGTAWGAFNKVRMTVFPKWYEYNHQNPVEVGAPFDILPGSAAANASTWGCVGGGCPSVAGSFDLQRFNVTFWRNFEGLVRQLGAAGIIADVILFHPYDNGHWGFDCLGGRDGAVYDPANDDFYLRYAAARLSAFSNVWWAMANEWSFCACKSYNATADNGPRTPVWDHLFRTLSDADPYGRQASIHNGNLLYNHSRPWITHVSLQGHIDDTAGLRLQYAKPVVWDEVKYEGNITDAWGALSGPEEADRFWLAAAKGVFAGHSDTVLDWRLGAHDDAQPLWWAKGGTLRGESPPRIAWFRQQSVAGDPTTGRPRLVGASSGVPTVLANGLGNFADALTASDGSQALLRFSRPGDWAVPLPTTPRPMPTGLCEKLEGVNCNDENIRNAGTVYHESGCCALCASDPECLAWTWNRGYPGQACWIKTGCTSRTSGDANVVSGVGALGPGPGPHMPAANHKWEIWHLDAWAMTASLVRTVSGENATIITAPAVPFIVQIVRRS